jgi:hypothetical protein
LAVRKTDSAKALSLLTLGLARLIDGDDICLTSYIAFLGAQRPARGMKVRVNRRKAKLKDF